MVDAVFGGVDTLGLPHHVRNLRGRDVLRAHTSGRNSSLCAVRRSPAPWCHPTPPGPSSPSPPADTAAVPAGIGPEVRRGGGHGTGRWTENPVPCSPPKTGTPHRRGSRSRSCGRSGPRWCNRRAATSTSTWGDKAESRGPRCRRRRTGPDPVPHRPARTRNAPDDRWAASPAATAASETTDPDHKPGTSCRPEHLPAPGAAPVPPDRSRTADLRTASDPYPQPHRPPTSTARTTHPKPRVTDPRT